MTKYYLWPSDPPIRSKEHLIRVRADGAISGIPMDESNSDYQQYLAWLAEGNTPEPWEATNGPE